MKIQDGLFICDETGTSDLDFIESNKITGIINAAGLEIKNSWIHIDGI